MNEKRPPARSAPGVAAASGDADPSDGRFGAGILDPLGVVAEVDLAVGRLARRQMPSVRESRASQDHESLHAANPM